MGIRTMEEANRYLQDVYMPAFNAEFMVTPYSDKSAFGVLSAKSRKKIF
jgi:hypothetical protein